MAKFLNFDTYMFQPDDEYWTRALQTLPRENLEKAFYDFTLASGVLTGLEVVQQPAPNLTVLIRAGRGIYRDPVTKRGTIIELHNDLSLDLSSFLPGGTPTTVKIVASPVLNTTTEAPMSVPNAPATLTDPDGTNPAHPDYDPAFTPYTFNPLERDDAFIEVDSTPSGTQIVLAEVTLSAGQTQILSSHINNTVRTPASNAAALALTITRVTTLESTSAANVAALADHETRLDVLESSVPGVVSTVAGHTTTLADHETRLDVLEAANTATLVETFLLVMPDTGSGVNNIQTPNGTIAQNFQNRTVMVHISSVNIPFSTGKVQFLLNLPGVGEAFVAEFDTTTAGTQDQQMTLSGHYPWAVGNLNTVSGVVSVELKSTLGVVFDTLNAQQIRITLHTID
ncbi:MAG: hypothetical protein HC933_08140 [Pleurocapsa sp. SU_196_0]|nr:hypothetical protein [Pleurocapsa sp. SU_196_0]